LKVEHECVGRKPVAPLKVFGAVVDGAPAAALHREGLVRSEVEEAQGAQVAAVGRGTAVGIVGRAANDSVRGPEIAREVGGREGVSC
jgi:hypothetical protein